MANPKPRRALAAAVSLITLIAAGGLSWLGAEAATDLVEARTKTSVTEALRAGGYDWAAVETDGLLVRLTGTAPDEVQRFRAKSQAEDVVDATRVVDNMQVQARASIGSPDFGFELLRNDDGVSILGLVPASVDRQKMVAALARDSGQEVSDLVETADYPEPEGWDAAFDFGLRAAGLASRAKISIKPGKVEVRAITDSEAEKARLEAALERIKPAALKLVTEITAPRPVIAPFTLRFVKDQNGARFDACSADSEESLERIVQSGVKAGIAGQPQCRLGLGAPTSHWADAAIAAVGAVAAMPEGSVTISDMDVALFAPATVTDEAFDAASGRLQAALPDLFSLRAEHEKKADGAQAPAEFSAVSDGQSIKLRGLVVDERMREAVESLASSRFGGVENALRVDDSVPEGWTLRAIAALEALSGLEKGTLRVTPELIRIDGLSGNQSASDLVATRLSQRLGAGAQYELAIRYDRRLDPLLKLPNGAECVDRLNVAMHESEIGFEPSKSVIAGDPKPTLEQLGTIMSDCGEYRVEIGGHTDSQGSEGFNADLSRNRAEAVLNAMKEHGIDVTNVTAKGYGESQPVSGNDTEEGREANRRIEFTLLSEEPVTVDQIEPARKVSGVTDTAEEAAARTAHAGLDAATAALGIVLGEDMPAHAAAPEADPQRQALLIEALTAPARLAAFPETAARADASEATAPDAPTSE